MTHWNIAKFAFACGVVLLLGHELHAYVDMLLGWKALAAG